METFQRRYVQDSMEESNSPHRLRHHLQEAARGRGDFPREFPLGGICASALGTRILSEIHEKYSEDSLCVVGRVPALELYKARSHISLVALLVTQ